MLMRDNIDHLLADCLQVGGDLGSFVDLDAGRHSCQDWSRHSGNARQVDVASHESLAEAHIGCLRLVSDCHCPGSTNHDRQGDVCVGDRREVNGVVLA